MVSFAVTEGKTHMAIPRRIPPFDSLSYGLQSGAKLQELSDSLGSGVQDVVAFAGGGKASATQINGVNAVLGTVATANDSVLLPLGYAGLTIVIHNNTATSAQVFGSGNDTINDIATGTGVPLAGQATAMYRCVGISGGIGLWFRFVSA
jgi:hypothetical protein